MAPCQGAEYVGSRSRCLSRYEPGRESIVPLLCQEASSMEPNGPLEVKSRCMLRSSPSPDATGGRAVSSSIGASVGTFLCEQPLAQGKRKSAGKRRRRGAAAMLSPTLEESDSLPQKKGARTFGEKEGGKTQCRPLPLYFDKRANLFATLNIEH